MFNVHPYKKYNVRVNLADILWQCPQRNSPISHHNLCTRDSTLSASIDFVLDSRTCVLSGMHYARLPAEVKPAPIGCPPSGQQGARAIECPGSALRALTPLQYSLSAPTATMAETMGAVCGAANPPESRRRRNSDITCLACGRRPLTRKLHSDGAATRTVPHDSEMIT